MKKVLSTISLIFILSLTTMHHVLAAETAPKAENSISFSVSADVLDFGPTVTKIMIEYPGVVSANQLDVDTFSVTTDNQLGGVPIENGQRTVENVWVSTSKLGEKAEKGNYLILELDSSLSAKYAKVNYWDKPRFTNFVSNISYKIKQNKPINNQFFKSYYQKEFIQPEVDKFNFGTSAEGLNYREYQPPKDGKKHPLIIWLHGGGEGGDSNVTQINGNRGAVAFIDKEAQAIFDNPYVVAPQTSSFWMPHFELEDGRVLSGTDQTAEVVSLIRAYLKEHKNIDKKRVYIGGCSMGGYQTWETLFAAPDLFAAAFPICAAYEVPKDQLNKVKNIPIWLTHAKTDNTVPVQNSREAYEGLKKINKRVEYTEYDSIEIEGTEINGHSSWVYFLQNKPETAKGQHVFEWLAKQKK